MIKIFISLAVICYASSVVATEYFHTSDDDEVILSLSHIHGMLEEQDETPLVRIYGSGRIHVHYPIYMRRAGDYELWLSSMELEELMAEAQLLLEFNNADVVVEVEELKQQNFLQSGQLIHISDSSYSELNIHLQYYAADDFVNALSKNKKIKWPDLQQSARRFSEVESLQSLAKLERHLLDLINNSKLAVRSE